MDPTVHFERSGAHGWIRLFVSNEADAYGWIRPFVPNEGTLTDGSDCSCRTKGRLRMDPAVLLERPEAAGSIGSFILNRQRTSTPVRPTDPDDESQTVRLWGRGGWEAAPTRN